MGQYESYNARSRCQGLYRVVNGIDIFDPKFNVVSPGADANIFFPYTDQQRRLGNLHEELGSLVFGKVGERRGPRVL